MSPDSYLHFPHCLAGSGNDKGAVAYLLLGVYIAQLLRQDSNGAINRSYLLGHLLVGATLYVPGKQLTSVIRHERTCAS